MTQEVAKPNRYKQYAIFLFLAALMTAFTGILFLSGGEIFQKFMGNLNPLLAMGIVTACGLAAFAFMDYRGWFFICRKFDARTMTAFSFFALILFAGIAMVDAKAHFPATMNVQFPQSLLFYPVMGFVADIIFHILPLCLLMVVGVSIAGAERVEVVTWICIAVVALVEPAFQVLFGRGDSPAWASAYVGVHVYVISFCQLYLLKKYDFVSMYSFRLTYYLFWHILWGHFRLGLFF